MEDGVAYLHHLSEIDSLSLQALLHILSSVPACLIEQTKKNSNQMIRRVLS